MKLFMIGLFFLLFTLIHLMEASQSQTLNDKDNRAIRIPTDLVTLDSQVLNKQTGQPIVNLKVEDFLLLEGGIRQKVSHFSLGKRKLSIMLLLDISASTLSYYTQIHNAGSVALKSLTPEDDLALMVFDSDATLVHGFTGDKQLIYEKMADLEGLWNARQKNTKNTIEKGGTHIGDSLYTAAEYLRNNTSPTSCRVIITVTDNDVSEKHRIHSRSDVTNMLLESDIVVYGLLIETPYTRSINSKSNKILKYNPATLIYFGLQGKTGGTVDLHAKHTGGVTIAAIADDLHERLANVINLLRQRYSFGYTSTNSKMDGMFRKIKLIVTPEIEKREGGVTILTRQGYYPRPRNSDSNAAKEPAAPKKN